MVAFGHFPSNSDHRGTRGKGSVRLRIAAGFTDTRELPPGDLVLVHPSVMLNFRRSAKDQGSHFSGLKGTELPFSPITLRKRVWHTINMETVYML